jgi:hypothetical protein
MDTRRWAVNVLGFMATSMAIAGLAAWIHADNVADTDVTSHTPAVALFVVAGVALVVALVLLFAFGQSAKTPPP